MISIGFPSISNAIENKNERGITYFKQSKKWSIEKADKWYAQRNWIVGCNFIPSTAVNTLELWQADTFDPKTINRELGFAQNIGFNSVRVFLHYLLWVQDSTGFKKRLNTYLNIASKHGISTMFVLFDDCWNGKPKLGKQPTPIPGVHNSRWVQCPGQKEVTDTALYPIFERYVKGIISAFKNDSRVIAWDLYNEPGNFKHGRESLPLLKNAFLWAREVAPSQPLTSGIWNMTKRFKKLNDFQLNHSDIITFHNYDHKKSMKAMIDSLRRYGRPLICTEYMRRPISTFKEILPLLKAKNVGAYNWGLVSGKTQTIYPWSSVDKPFKKKPKVWFHDIFKKNGEPYDSSEIKLIKSLTSGYN